jgi:hypothetical protein
MGSVPKDCLFLRLFMPLQESFAQLYEHATALDGATMSTKMRRFAAGRSNGVPLAREKLRSRNRFGALAIEP